MTCSVVGQRRAPRPSPRPAAPPAGLPGRRGGGPLWVLSPSPSSSTRCSFPYFHCPSTFHLLPLLFLLLLSLAAIGGSPSAFSANQLETGERLRLLCLHPSSVLFNTDSSFFHPSPLMLFQRRDVVFLSMKKNSCAQHVCSVKFIFFVNFVSLLFIVFCLFVFAPCYFLCVSEFKCVLLHVTCSWLRGLCHDLVFCLLYYIHCGETQIACRGHDPFAPLPATLLNVVG